MRVMVCGSRGINLGEGLGALLGVIIKESIKPTVIISGKAKGGDEVGERYAQETNIPVEEFPPDWKKFGKRAGFIRNAQMVDVADVVIALWDGKSRGTKNSIDYARKMGLPVFVKIIEEK